MTKALLVIGTLCAFATADAFVASFPRVATPSSCSYARTRSSAAIMNLPSQTRVRMQQKEQQQVSPKFGRAARTLLFSTPAASAEDAPAPVVAAEKGGKAAPSTIKVTAYFGLWYLFNIGYGKNTIHDHDVVDIFKITSSYLGAPGLSGR